ncbi:autophagy-related protein 9A [Folsomia candida]|uniref:autophagy-related protein 9A n=1 Tax=Folsomia candida TaxID=158441 RepID=UPI000B90593B|nr:autophagy-related protein 9A [Folsomia candida]
MERAGYQSLVTFANGNDINNGDDNVPPNDHNVMAHVPEHNKTRWNHIEDLDSFFNRVYYYHQKHGFVCIILQEVFELLQFIFVVCFATFLFECVDYPILFGQKLLNTTSPTTKITLDQAVIPMGECVAGFNFWMWTILIVAAVFWLLRLVFVIYNTSLNWEIRAFYRTALGIADIDIDNLTWNDVQTKLIDVQREQQMCIMHKDLTALDIYHRILRFKNYMVAMVNKKMLPLTISIPFIGDTIVLTHGLKYNLEMILFWGPWAPFENSWHLREDYKKVSKRKELANALRKRILWIGIANFLLLPLIFLWQILYSFFNYAEIVKREPGTLGTRKWSLYGRLFFRHFNELEHQINARLSRAYRPASKYMSIFNAPIMTILAQNIAFVCGAVFAVLSLLAIWDEDVLTVEHVLLLITVLGTIIAVCRAFIPNEQLILCPETLLTAVIAHVHYFPDEWQGQCHGWKGKAHTTPTRDLLSDLFSYKATYLALELLSPIITPYILCFKLRSEALALVDFFRNFTVEVVGVGDVCSFAQMDVRKHGNPTWQASTYDMDSSDLPPKNSFVQAANGKTELSLVHFTHTNPEWKLPKDAGTYITNLKERAAKELGMPVIQENALFASLNSISSLGDEYSNVVTSLLFENQLLRSVAPGQIDPLFDGQQPTPPLNPRAFSQFRSHNNPMQMSYRGNVNQLEGPPNFGRRGILAGLNQSQHYGSNVQEQSNINMMSFANSFAQYPNPMLSQRPNDTNIELHAVDMSLDALYLHELHNMEVRRRTSQPGYSLATSMQQNNNQNSAFYESQPQLHSSNSSPIQEQQTVFQSERTPLLSTTNTVKS